ncbi:hypothetical protein BJX62DRAFT_232369 [Aspergillus germanicus]
MTYFSDFYFTSNLTSFACPDFGNSQCVAPKACARDPSTGKGYCCDPSFDGETGSGVCWALTSDCTNDNRQLTCRSGSSDWCCLYETEECTGVPEQRNVCWNRERSPLRNISVDVLEDLYSSLTSDAPTARTWAFDPATLLPETSVLTSTTTTTTTTPTATGTITTSPVSSPNNDSSDSLSGGAIAGIVVGAVAGVVIVLGGAFFLIKRRRKRVNGGPKPPPAELGYETRPVNQLYEADGNAMKMPLPPQELPAR